MPHEAPPIPQPHTNKLLLPMAVPTRRRAWLSLGLTLAIVLHLFGASVVLWAAQFKPPTEPPRLITLLLREGRGHGEGENQSPSEGNNSKSDNSKNNAPAKSELAATHTGMVRQTTTRPTPSVRPESSITPAPSTTASVSPVPQPLSLAKNKRQASPNSKATSAPTATASNTASAPAFASAGTPGNGNGTGIKGHAKNDEAGGMSNGDRAVPSLAQFTKPTYPRRSRQAGEEGAVLLEAHVSPQGQLLGVRVVQSSGYPRLDEAARNSLHKARFAPAIRQGRPVAGHLMVPFAFNLKDDA